MAGSYLGLVVPIFSIVGFCRSFEAIFLKYISLLRACNRRSCMYQTYAVQLVRLSCKAIQIGSERFVCVYIINCACIGKSHINKLTIEDFHKCKTPKKAFRKLSPRMLDYLLHADFYKIRRACIEDAYSPDGTELPTALVDDISRTNNISELFDVLAKSHYWNWIDVRMMEIMVDVADIPEAEQMLNDYKEFVSPIRIKQILPYLQLHVVSTNYTTVKEKFKSSDEDTLTVGDILKHQFYLAFEILNIKPLFMRVCSIQTGCLQLILEIPNESTSHAYNSALANCHKFDKIHSLKIGNYSMIYSSDYSPTEVVPGIYMHMIRLPTGIYVQWRNYATDTETVKSFFC